jgi:hypothetical protein
MRMRVCPARGSELCRFAWFCRTKTAMRTMTVEQAMIAGQWDRVFSSLGCALMTPRRGVGREGGSLVRRSTSGGDDAVVDLGW